MSNELTVVLNKEFYSVQHELYDFCRKEFGIPKHFFFVENKEECLWGWDCAFGTQFFEFKEEKDKIKFKEFIKEKYGRVLP